MTRTVRPLRLLPLLLVALAGCAQLMPAAISPAAAPLAVTLDPIFDEPALDHAHWGVLVRSLDTGEVLYQRNAERLFTPASTTKLLTGAAMLQTLGPDYRYFTTIATAGPVRNGALEGALVVTGTGDPTLSARFLDDARDVFREWADSLRVSGIDRIAGSIVGVDTAFVDPPLGAGWMWDDLAFAEAAEFGALQFNEGIVELEVFPSSSLLGPGIVVLSPPTQYVRVVNDTRTMPLGSVTTLEVTRDEVGAAIIVRGEIARDVGGFVRRVAVRDPTLYLVSVLRETLREEGIVVEGPAIRHTELVPNDPALRQAIPLFTHRSPPLREILPGMMKVSQNQMAEIMLRTVGRELRGEGSATAGAAAIDSVFRSWGISPLRFRLADGSGMSRYNLVSPALLVDLLGRMHASDYRDVWLASLPVAGRDGTLAARMRNPPLFEQVQAKTGTLSGVRALSGYLTTQRGERLAFAVVINSHLFTAADVDRVVERALETIATLR